jgi:metal-dependent amidase/aminoacylase/carboxypeptidase family protein
VSKGSNGCITKTITYTGKSAHAGGSPHAGINALYAANQGISAINALRETFKDSDHIRVHPIITWGGTAVNAIPEKVTMESYVRGASMEAIGEANKKVNRALAASAAALGANVEICDRPGYSPRLHDKGMMELTRDAMEETLEVVNYDPEGWGTGCSDLGDVSMVMPAVHPYIYGATGTGHGADYVITDTDTALVDSARVQAAMIVKLLENEGARVAQVKKNFVPTFPSMEEFFRCIDGLTMDQKAVTYNEDGTITLKFMK